MKRVLIAGLAVLGGGAVFVLRDELNRYVRIKRMATNPALVGASVTPQGNKLALHRSPEQRLWDRGPTGIRPGASRPAS